MCRLNFRVSTLEQISVCLSKKTSCKCEYIAWNKQVTRQNMLENRKIYGNHVDSRIELAR